MRIHIISVAFAHLPRLVRDQKTLPIKLPLREIVVISKVRALLLLYYCFFLLV